MSQSADHGHLSFAASHRLGRDDEYVVHRLHFRLRDEDKDRPATGIGQSEHRASQALGLLLRD